VNAAAGRYALSLIDIMNYHGEKSFKLLFFFTIIFLAVISYATVSNSFFLSDDFPLIGRTLTGEFHWYRAVPGAVFFRPLVILSFTLESALWGVRPMGYHLTSIVLHGINSYLVFALATKLIQKTSPSVVATTNSVPVAAGLIFLLQPSHTEAVSWIAGRGDVMSTFFCLSALLGYVTFRLKNYAVCLVVTLPLLLMALFAKETALCLPGIILTFEAFSASGSYKVDKVKRLIIVGLLSAFIIFVYFLIRHLQLGAFIAGYGADVHLNFRLSLIYDEFPTYIFRAVLPPLPEWILFFPVKALKLGVLMIFSLCAAILAAPLIYKNMPRLPSRLGQSGTLLLMLLVSFICSLIPVITMDISLVDTQNERFLYLPTAFISIFLARISFDLIRPKRIWAVTIIGLLIFYSVSLYDSNRNWREAGQLSRSILEDISTSSGGENLIVVNAPDNLRGAYVYRNGLYWALKEFQHSRHVDQVWIVDRQDLRTLYDEVQVIKDSNIVLVLILEGKIRVYQQSVTPNCIDVLERSEKTLKIQVNSCPSGTEILFLNRGRLVKIEGLQ